MLGMAKSETCGRHLTHGYVGLLFGDDQHAVGDVGDGCVTFEHANG